MKSLLPQKFHNYLYYFGLMVVLVGMPLSKFMMSIGQIIMLGNFLIQGHWKLRLQRFWNNKAAVCLSSVMLLLTLGLINTSNFHEAYLDMNIKFPMFALPLLIASAEPIPIKLFNSFLKLFVSSVFGCTIFSTLILVDVVHRSLLDARGISIFISHIRFALLICIAIFILSKFFKDTTNFASKLICVLLIGWFIVFMFLMQSLTGIFILLFTIYILCCLFYVKRSKSILKYPLFGFMILAPILGVVNSYYKHKKIFNTDLPKENQLETKTKHGHYYHNEVHCPLTENGNFIWIYVCDTEMRDAWNKRSKFNFDSNDVKGNRETIVSGYIDSLASKRIWKHDIVSN